MAFNSYIDGFRKSFEFKGKTKRIDFWSFLLIDVLAGICASIIDTNIQVLTSKEEFVLFTSLWLLSGLIPRISLTIRRLHDIGKSGWWIFLSSLPIVGGIIIWYWLLLPSKENKQQDNIGILREGYSGLGKASFTFASIGLSMFIILFIIRIGTQLYITTLPLEIMMYLCNSLSILSGIPSIFTKRRKRSLIYLGIITSIFTSIALIPINA